MKGNQQPWKRRSGSAKSPEIQPASSPSTTTQPETCQTSVNISSDDDNHADTCPSVQTKPSSWSKMVVLCYRLLICACTAFLTAAVALLVGGLVSILTIICSAFAAVVALPLLSVSFLVLRFLQFFKYGDDYDKTIQLKLFIRTWILLDMLFYLGTLWLLFAFSKRAPILGHIMFIGLPIVNWLSLCNVIFGIYASSYVISVFTINYIPLVSSDHTESSLNVPEGVLEIIDCLILWFAEYEVMTHVPALNHHKMLGLHTHNWIEGIIFVFVVHPFYVGDLCVIDGNMMEVRTIGIWKTTLSKVSTQEEVIYSNSELFNKSIINHKTNFDWNDYVELDVSSLDKKTIKILKNEIEEYLDWVEDKFIPGYNSVEVLTNGDNVKLIVYFRHRVNLRNHTYFECLKEKRKLRSGFVLHAEDLVDQYKNREQRNSDGTTDVAQDD
ncbi:hypothetical protein SOVF_086210 [Spinacia oleracea]|nr:hypothetical protein SOVF_086210 [Spinacia oleracea]